MNKFKLPGNDELGSIKQKFSELEIATEILQHEPGNSTPRCSASDLLSYTCGDLSRERQIKRELVKYPSMRTALRSMIAGKSIYSMAEAIAASSGEFPNRKVEGCRIRVEVSNAEPDQYYVIIDQMGGYEVDLSEMDLFGRDNGFERIPLPEARRGIIQLVVKTSDNVLNLLRDPKTSIFLR